MIGIWTFPGVAASHAAGKANTPYGIFVQRALDPWFNKKYPLEHLKKWIYWRIQYAVLHDAHAAFFTSYGERNLAKTSFRKNEWNGVVIPYGINDPEDGHPNHAEQIETFCGVMPQLRGRRFLLFLARIHEKKGCNLLIETFAKVAGPGSRR
jgi:glycosyltransferase involved in cell wall biosynthesis